MSPEQKNTLKHLILLEGVPAVMEDIFDICEKYADEIRANRPDTAAAWDRVAGSLSYALQTIDFSGRK